VTIFSFEISTSFVAVGFGKFVKVSFFCMQGASDFFSWQFLKSHQRSKVFFILQLAFGLLCGGLLFLVATHTSFLALMCLLFLLQFSVNRVAAFCCKRFSGWT